MREIIRRMLRRVLFSLYPHPRAVKIMGCESIILFPRRLEGARVISIGEDVIINANSWISAVDCYGTQTFSPTITIGDHVRIGRGAIITAIDFVNIGEGCLFSEQIFISDHAHSAIPGPLPPARQPLVSRGPVKIGRHCFIGIRAVIMSGVTLGDYCVVGANSVVTRSFPAGSVIAGAPARLLRTLPIATVSPQERKEIAPDSL